MLPYFVVLVLRPSEPNFDVEKEKNVEKYVFVYVYVSCFSVYRIHQTPNASPVRPLCLLRCTCIPVGAY